MTNFDLFLKFCRDATNVIYMDAFTSNRTLDYVGGVVDGEDGDIVYQKTGIIVDYVPPPKAMDVIQIQGGTIEEVYPFIKNNLNEGKKLVIVCASKTGNLGLDKIEALF